MKKITLYLLLYCLVVVGVQAQQRLWQDVSEQSFALRTTQRDIVPQQYRTLAITESNFKKFLWEIPEEGNTSNNNMRTTSSSIELPMPDGSFQKFRVLQFSMMEAGLAAQFPEIKTFTLKGIDDPTATGTLSWTYKGFNAMVISEKGTFFIDPYQRGDKEHYISYYKKDYINEAKASNCLYEPDVKREAEISKMVEDYRRDNARMTGDERLTYRLAVACTGEYARAVDGTSATVSGVLSAIVITVNRVNGIYEREFAIRLTLIANNSAIVFTNPSTDPFTGNNNAGTLINESQSVIDSNIGNANYDIGHTFSTGGGGLAGLGVVCINSSKGRGITGSANPVGDAYDVDYVAHEIGHQFGGPHTFNGSSGSCAGGNRSAASAYEPGSGTTIMAYAGICTGQNLQSNSNDYFHVDSFDSIVAYSRNSSGNSCAVKTPLTNEAPNNITVPTAGFTIPFQTAFTLEGTASDPNSDALTYCWEQFDLGSAGAPTSPTGNAPIFRSYSPTTSPARTFPKLEYILDDGDGNTIPTLPGGLVAGELLPTYDRLLTFRMTVRDNFGGVDYRQTSFNVTSSAGPFVVTAPNTNTNWVVGTTQLVTWDVANTNQSPVNCNNVNILLSTDGGQTYPVTLLSNTPNDGKQEITVPTNITSNARIKIEAADNIFFDIGNANFSIANSTTGAPLVVSVFPTDNAVNIPIDENLIMYFNQDILKGTGNILVKKLADNSVLESIDVSSASVTLSGNKATIDLSVSLGDCESYYVEIPNTVFRNAGNQFYAGMSNNTTWNFTSVGNCNPTVTLLEPANGATEVSSSQVSITFDRPIKKGSFGSIRLSLFSSNITVEQISITSDKAVVDGNKVTFTFSALNPFTQYYITVPNGAISDVNNNAFQGILNKNSWTFTTGATITSLEKLSENQLLIYPNPTAEGLVTLKLDYKNAKINTVEVWNTLGERVVQKEVLQQETSVDLQSQPKGIYLIKVFTDNKIAIKRLVRL